MKDCWVGNDVDLNLLSQRVKHFFIENQFETKLEQAPDKYWIEASNFQFKVMVNVYGQPSDFTVEFIPNKKTRGFSLAMAFGYFTSVFGGGTLLLRDVKLQEAINKVEQKFWEHIDRQVAVLTNSANKQLR